jgi:hypothetical protein
VPRKIQPSKIRQSDLSAFEHGLYVPSCEMRVRLAWRPGLQETKEARPVLVLNYPAHSNRAATAHERDLDVTTFSRFSLIHLNCRTSIGALPRPHFARLWLRQIDQDGAASIRKKACSNSPARAPACRALLGEHRQCAYRVAIPTGSESRFHPGAVLAAGLSASATGSGSSADHRNDFERRTFFGA